MWDQKPAPLQIFAPPRPQTETCQMSPPARGRDASAGQLPGGADAPGSRERTERAVGSPAPSSVNKGSKYRQVAPYLCHQNIGASAGNRRLE